MRAFFYAAVGALAMGAVWCYSSSNQLTPKKVDVLEAQSQAEFGTLQAIPSHGQDRRDQSVQELQITEEKIVTETVRNSPAAKDGSNARPVHQVKYIVEDGLAIVNGDIVLGEPTGTATSGSTTMEEVHLWPQGIVPYHIQDDVPNKDQVIRAMSHFNGTAIQFVPYSGQEDVLVFESGPGCRSYLGKIGGKQPLWISGGCSAKEITHEIMHALGFIHEQNRPDRDAHVKVIWDNILDKYRHNFEIFPANLMRASGANTFDYHSIMLYEPHAFAKNPGIMTLVSTHAELEINPNPSLSAGDRLRLNKVYNSR